MKKLLFSLFALILPLAVSAEGWDDALYKQIEQNIKAPTFKEKIYKPAIKTTYSAAKNQKAINKATWKNAKKGLLPQTTEEEYGNILNTFIQSEEQNLSLDKEYLKKYQSVLSNKKIFKVLHAEIKFNRNMLKILQEMDKK